MKYNLQYFGGRGASSPAAIPNGGQGGEGEWSKGAGTRVESDPVKALGAQGRAKGVEDATMNTNPNHNYEYREYSENCQRCVVAYEARRRGYDVTAQPTYEGDTMPRHGEWTRNFEGAKTDNISATTKAKAVNNLEAKMAEYGEGSRAVVSVQWERGGGHVFMVEQKNGKTIYRDPQVGVRYDKATVFTNVKPGRVELTRVDNLSFSNSIGEAVTKEKY